MDSTRQSMDYLNLRFAHNICTTYIVDNAEHKRQMVFLIV